MFNNGDAKQVLEYVRENYQTNPEFLWAKSPGSAVLRHKSNNKWYGALLNIPKQKLGIKDDGNINVLDLKCDPVLKHSLIDNKKFFPGYHMNKEYWITIILNETVPINDIFYFIDLSYELTK